MMADRVIASEAVVWTVKWVEGGKALEGECADRKARVWDADSGAQTQVREVAGARRRRVAPGREKFAQMAGIGGVSTMAESPDGKWLAAASYDTDVRVWKTADEELVRLIDELKVSMFDMQFSPDGKWLAMAGADRTVHVWETGSWKLARKFEGQPELIAALDYSPDGRMLVTGGFNDAHTALPVSVMVWEAATGRVVRKVAAKRTVSDVAFAPDGQRVAAAYGSKEIGVWDVKGG